MPIKQSYRLKLDGLTERMNQTFHSKDIDSIRDKFNKAKTSRLCHGWTLYWDGLIVREGKFRAYSFK